MTLYLHFFLFVLFYKCLYFGFGLQQLQFKKSTMMEINVLLDLLLFKWINIKWCKNNNDNIYNYNSDQCSSFVLQRMAMEYLQSKLIYLKKEECYFHLCKYFNHNNMIINTFINWLKHIILAVYNNHSFKNCGV